MSKQVTNVARAAIAVMSIGAVLSGCAAESAAPESVESTSSEALSIAPGAFVGQHVVSGWACGWNEVMIGVYYSWYSPFVVCAELNGYSVKSRIVDANYSTQVGYAYGLGTMHGCPSGTFMQSINGDDSNFTCVLLEDKAGRAVTPSTCYRDGIGAGNDGTQSTTEYGLGGPRMHVCPHNYAMAGLHVSLNDLWCCE